MLSPWKEKQQLEDLGWCVFRQTVPEAHYTPDRQRWCDPAARLFSIYSQTSNWLYKPLETEWVLQIPQNMSNNNKMQPNALCLYHKMNLNQWPGVQEIRKYDIRTWFEINLDAAGQYRSCWGATLRVIWLLWLSLFCHSSTLSWLPD